MLLTPSAVVVLNVKITPNFSRQNSILVCHKLNNINSKKKTVTLYERTVTSFARTEVSALKIETMACNEVLTGAHLTPCVTQLQMQTALKKINEEINTKR